MGLDMYLTAKRYISDYDDSGKALRDHLEDLKVNGMTVKELSYEAGYWRRRQKSCCQQATDSSLAVTCIMMAITKT